MLNRMLFFRGRENTCGTDWEGLQRSLTLLKLHTPKDPQRDPILVALVIALAQRQRRDATKPLPPDVSFTVGLLLSPFGP
jgi:hypothetical protein